jgi:hypothetical protein
MAIKDCPTTGGMAFSNRIKKGTSLLKILTCLAGRSRLLRIVPFKNHPKMPNSFKNVNRDTLNPWASSF